MSRPTRDFNDSVSGQELWLWRQQALQDAIAHSIPVSEVDWLLQALTPLTRLELRLASFKSASLVQLAMPIGDLKTRWHQRVAERIPVQYIVGHTQWRDFHVSVSPAVLIPRPETELLIDLAVAATDSFPSMRRGHWVDLGTGSGAIALGLATAFPDATVHGVDCSEAALAIAAKNIQDNSAVGDRQDRGNGHTDYPSDRHGPALHKRIHLHHGSWFERLDMSRLDMPPNGQFSGIVSNPPYIPSDMVLELQPEVTLHEPHLALNGGSDGLDCLRHLISQASTYLVSNGVFLLEMMAGQAETVAQLINQHGDYYSTEIYSDLAGIDRFILTRCK